MTNGDFLQNKVNEIIQKFQSQYPEIDEKSYKFGINLDNQDKINKIFLKNFKKQEFNFNKLEIFNSLEEYLDFDGVNITQKRKKILNQIKFSKQNFKKIKNKIIKELNSEKVRLEKNKKENNEKIKSINKKIRRLNL